jgi:hypothetical protein
MTVIRDVWSPEWPRLGYAEIRRRIKAEFCEKCGATENQPCMSKHHTTLRDYTHRDRAIAAMTTFNLERQRAQH